MECVVACVLDAITCPVLDVTLVAGIGPFRGEANVVVAIELEGPAMTVTGNDFI